MSRVVVNDRTGLRTEMCDATRDVVLGERDVREYDEALQRAKVTLWSQMRMDARTARLEAARERLVAARAALAESELRDLVAAMAAMFEAAGNEFVSETWTTLRESFGIFVTAIDYEGRVAFVDQFRVFAKKFVERGFEIPTLTFEWTAETDVYRLVDRRECSTGEEWRFELSVPRALFAQEDWLFWRLGEMTDEFSARRAELSAAADDADRERRRAEFLRLKAEFEPDVGGES